MRAAPWPTKQSRGLHKRLKKNMQKMIACECVCHCVWCVHVYIGIDQLKRSPTVGRGAREVAEPMGSLEKSGKLAR